MKKTFSLLIVLIVSILSIKAQKSTSLDLKNEKIFHAGYVIRAFHNNTTGFGYDIFFQNRLVIHQVNNPFTMAPTGLVKKEDAFKIAIWQIDQFQLKLNTPGLYNQRISKNVAKQLNITID
jgi:hypothetical protein